MKSMKAKVIVVMCVALLIMVTGYAYFATNLDITATGNITTSLSTNGNKMLTYPIGFLTIDEASYAGGVTYEATQGGDISNPTNYLATGDFDFWTMSPTESAMLHDGNTSAAVWMVQGNGGLNPAGLPASTAGIRPVINLKGGLEIEFTGTGAHGTATNPYIIKTN